MQLPLPGGCLCNSIRYEIIRMPISVYTCHCTDCQRITSSAFSIGVVVPAKAFRPTGNAAKAVPGGVTAGGRIKIRWVCPDCGTTLYGGPKIGEEAPDYNRVVRGGTLDNTSWLRPTTHFWTRSKQPWVVLPGDATVFETQPSVF
jgi:hypothetical protein